jgi:acetyl esterase/lipase
MKSKIPFVLLHCVSATALFLATPAFAQEARKKEAAPPRPPVPAGIKAYRDLEYVPGGHERQKLDLFIPEKTGDAVPLIIWVHGGGWQNGSKEGCPPLRNGYTGRGYAVASINYRLSGHAVFPAQIEDCKAAIRWLRAHAKEYHLDANRFGVWGSSAGGHLVALLGTSGEVKAFDVGTNLDRSSRVQAVCDYYGPTDFSVFVTTPGFESHARPEAPEGKLLGGAVLENKDKAGRANPIAYVSKDDPPFLIVHGNEDRTVPINQSQLLFAALKTAGVSAHFHTIHGAGHGTGFGGPEIEPMVRDFFEQRLKSGAAAAVIEATTSESKASSGPQTPGNPKQGTIPPGAQRGPGIPFDQVLSRNDKDKDGRLSREEFPGPPALFERMDANRDGYITRDEHERGFPVRPPENPKATPQGAALPTGLLYFASYPQRDNPAPVANPNLVGALFTIYWSDIERQQGVFDWSDIDRRLAMWTSAGKKVALRIMWSSSGNWPEPAAKHPTPQFVLDAGAVTVRSESSKTDIPLFWDPIYQKHAASFLREAARKFDGNPNLLFFDVTPGAETNPYRFRRINVNEPEFKQRFADTPASDGRKYTHELWLETVKQGVDSAVAQFKKTPLLVTLNAGSLDGPEQFQAIGDYCVSHGCYVGQNGLNARSYDSESARKTAFRDWAAKTKFYFEMVDASGGNTGSLMDVVKAAERIGCSFLGVYAADVLRGTKGQANFDPEFEAALAYGAKVLGQLGTTPAQAAAPTPAAPNGPTAAPKNNAKGNPDTRTRTATWLLPPVEGANLNYGTFESKTAGEKVSYLIYLPPGYEQDKQKRYPVVYWLHGVGGAQTGVPQMTARLTSAIEAGETPPFLWVFVNGMIRSWYVDAANGKYPVETVTIKELIPHIDAAYRTVARREGRMIEGFSMGGAGTARWGFKHPELFGSISVLAGALGDNADTMKNRDGGKSFEEIYGGKMENFEAENLWKWTEKNAVQVRGRTAIRVVVGGKDQLQGVNTRYHELLDQLGLKHEFEVVPDAIHSPNPVYDGLGDKNWAFYRTAFARVAVPLPATAPSNPKAENEPKPAPAAPRTSSTPQGFHQNGERWTYREGDFEMNGVLLKPEGKGPFPAVLISHGLGGTAENFGLGKAREFVKWGFLCIAPDYTHSARFLAGRRPGVGKGGAPKGAPQSSAKETNAPRSNPQQFANYGASEENLHRARTCIELVCKLPEVDAKRIAAYGHSMGGFVTIGLAAAAPDLMKSAACSGSGVAPRDGFPAPPVTAAERIRTPFLMLHGSADNTVRPSQSESLKEVLDRNKVPNERLVFEGEGHPIDQTKREEVFTRLREWFTRHGVLKEN